MTPRSVQARNGYPWFTMVSIVGDHMHATDIRTCERETESPTPSSIPDYHDWLARGTPAGLDTFISALSSSADRWCDVDGVAESRSGTQLDRICPRLRSEYDCTLD